MNRKLTFATSVLYGDVDRTEVLTLHGVGKLLQEAAIAHANQFDLGAHAMRTRGESWVLNRMALAIHRYPRYEETLRMETWSRGIKGFKGYREFRLYDARDALLLSGSSLWLYVNVRTKAIIRVSAAQAAAFPIGEGESFCPELESLEFAVPSREAATMAMGVRYSDVDVNLHVNNTAYFDYVQEALARAGRPVHPQAVRFKFGRGIPADAAAVSVRMESNESGAVFAIEDGATTFAVGMAG